MSILFATHSAFLDTLWNHTVRWWTTAFFVLFKGRLLQNAASCNSCGLSFCVEAQWLGEQLHLIAIQREFYDLCSLSTECDNSENLNCRYVFLFDCSSIADWQFFVLFFLHNIKLLFLLYNTLCKFSFICKTEQNNPQKFDVNQLNTYRSKM